MTHKRTTSLRRLLVTRAALLRLAILMLILVGAVGVLYWIMIPMPGKRFSGPLPPATDEQRTLAQHLEADVTTLASDIGERHVIVPRRLHAAADWIESELSHAGYQVRRQAYEVSDAELLNQPVLSHNLEVELFGADRPEEIVIIGAHYDTVFGSPGANDNASGVAATLALASHFAEQRPGRTLRFVFFANEEPPFFQTDAMGSRVYARAARANGENIVAMIAMETIGHYSDEPDSQRYPPPANLVYPTRGDFIGFVSNIRSRRLLREVVGTFRAHAEFPSEGGALFGGIPGVGWSDHWAFWQEGYPGLMVTDTALFRYPHYHLPSDTPEKLDFDRMARVVHAMIDVVSALCNP